MAFVNMLVPYISFIVQTVFVQAVGQGSVFLITGQGFMISSPGIP